MGEFLMLDSGLLTKFVDPLPRIPIAKPLRTQNGIPFYTISMKEKFQKLHRDLPETKIWGYGGRFPGPTIHVWQHQPIHVLWRNDLPTKHFLPIDKTVHGAEPSQPEVRTVVHLHGGVTKEESDGYPEAWFTHHFNEVGPYFRQKVYEYPNIQQASTLWYHDHAMGITRLNIYAGLAGFYLIHDVTEYSLPLPKGEYDVPLLLQDRSVNEDGSLYYPSQPTPPIETVNPSVIPDFFGNMNLVNGKVWPYFEVEPRKYRFRLLNGANARFYRLSLSNGLPFIQIGTDQGLLPSPVLVHEITLAPAERADVILDFTQLKMEELILLNNAPSPFPQGEKPDPSTEGVVMKFIVNQKRKGMDQTYIPPVLASIPKLEESSSIQNRKLLLNMKPDTYGRSIHLLNNRLWSDPITEAPNLWSMEVWSLINVSKATHPIHLHLVKFQLLDRQPFDRDRYEKEGKIVLTGVRKEPDLNEKGWKDTVRANPGEITRIIVPFGPYSGLFVWHCHILEHEDYEMMRPYKIIPNKE